MSNTSPKKILDEVAKDYFEEFGHILHENSSMKGCVAILFSSDGKSRPLVLDNYRGKPIKLLEVLSSDNHALTPRLQLLPSNIDSKHSKDNHDESTTNDSETSEKI